MATLLMTQPGDWIALFIAFIAFGAVIAMICAVVWLLSSPPTVRPSRGYLARGQEFHSSEGRSDIAL